MNEIKTGMYEHFKGKKYEVIGTARHSETLEPVVVYKALYKGEFPEGSLWVRPLAMFAENVTTNGKQVPRFRYLGVFLFFFLLAALMIPSAFAQDGENANNNEWGNLENALKQQGIIQSPNQPTTTTETLPDGSRRTVTTTPSGRRSEVTVKPNGETETKYTGGDPGKTGPTEITDVYRPDGSRTITVHYVTGWVGQSVTQRDGSSVETNTYPGGSRNTTTRNTSGHITNETFTDENGATRTVETVYSDPVKGTKQREVRRNAQGQIEEVIYYNPDGSWNRTSRDPNAPPRFPPQAPSTAPVQTGQAGDGNAFGDGVGVASGKFDTTGMETQVAQAEHSDHGRSD